MPEFRDFQTLSIFGRAYWLVAKNNRSLAMALVQQHLARKNPPDVSKYTYFGSPVVFRDGYWELSTNP